ncbi:alpha-tectorin-like [Dicentrarchus labrax]|uniref:alpha-tectorin-like n=1 Tax=Dicentrarchus labrax TaxID=13489 RepID=UPI0021F66837|nr:alpha-tectorin-like [Dicentrarchus labrax]
MLRLLLYLSALSQLTGATAPLYSSQINISSCPIPYFGKLYQTLYVNISTNGTLAICFNNYFSEGNENDCLLLDSQGYLQNVSSKINTSTANSGSQFHVALGQLAGSSPCSVTLMMQDNATSTQLTTEMRPFGYQAAVLLTIANSSLKPFLEFKVHVNGVELRNWNITKGQMHYKDMSSCRHSGLVYETDTVACDSEHSSVVTCNATAALSVSPCGSFTRCHGNGQCVLKPTCTVTGPAVIDFNGNVTFIQNRCAYTLMSLPGLKLLATFQERRRKDISFLDSVILRLDGPSVDIKLGQGGKVQLDNTTLSLNSSSQTKHNVELSKDQNGVTAKVLLSNLTAFIIFDGTTAQIRMNGSASLQGLCANSSSSLSEVKFTEFSSASCETEHNDTVDSRINCTMMTEHCNLLKEAPFTSCNHIDPEPYITACNNTLCRYPAVDSLQCQFLEAYARACGLLNDTQDGWRSKTRCSPSQGFCQDTYCSDHEFCGEDITGRSNCLCRADFAAKYKSTGDLGDPTVCGNNTATVSLPGCLLTERGINHSVLHLNNDSCRGYMDEKTHIMTFSFNSSNPCGAVILADNKTVTYKNTIKTTDSNSSALISRQSTINLDFSCFYSQPDDKQITFKIKGSTGLRQVVSGTWNYSLSMGMFSDAECTKPINFTNGVTMGQTIYINLDTDGLDGNVINLVIESCSATSKANDNGGPKYDLIKNGCGNPNDKSVKVLKNKKGGSIIAFEIFKFKGSNSGVFLNCKMKLCVKNNPSCQPKCQQGGRKRRSLRPLTFDDENPAIVTLAWT